MMEGTESFGDIGFFPAGLVFCHSSFLNSLPWDLEWILHRWGTVCPHLHISSALFWGCIMWGIAAIFGGVLSSSFFILMNMGVEVSLGGNWP